MNPLSELPAHFCTDSGVTDLEAAVNKLFSLPFRTSPCLLPNSLNEKLQRFSLILFSICCLLGETRAQYFLRPMKLHGVLPFPSQDSGPAVAE